MSDELTQQLIDAAGGLMHKLDRILRELEQEGTEDIGLGAVNGPAQWLGNFPHPGSRRHLPSGRASGSDALAVPQGAANAVNVVGADKGRMGGLIVNYGASPCLLYFAPVDAVIAGNTSGIAATWLSGLGGSWDFVMGPSSRLWCGDVTAVGVGGATTIAFAVT